MTGGKAHLTRKKAGPQEPLTEAEANEGHFVSSTNRWCKEHGIAEVKRTADVSTPYDEMVADFVEVLVEKTKDMCEPHLRVEEEYDSPVLVIYGWVPMNDAQIRDTRDSIVARSEAKEEQEREQFARLKKAHPEWV